MKQTENYQLNQWELTDRIRMEDFNGDNAKIDEAMKAISDTVTEHAAALADMGQHLIKEMTIPSTCKSFDIPMNDIDWSQWKHVHVVVEAITESACNVYLAVNGGSVEFGGGGGNEDSTPQSSRKVLHLMLFPYHDPRLYAIAMNLNGGNFFSSGIQYPGLSSLRLACSNSTYNLCAGTMIQISGEK